MRITIDLRDSLLCPFQLLLDLHHQLSCFKSPPIEHLAFQTFGTLDSANDWINLESLGNSVTIKAHTLVKTLRTALPEALSLVIYLNQKKITSDNLYSLFLLADELQQMHLCFYDEQEWDDLTQHDWSQLFAHKRVSLAFMTDTATPGDFPLLNQLHSKRLALMAQYGFDFSLTDNLNLLIGYAWSLLKSGAPEVATNLLENALNSALPSHYCQFLLHLQIIGFHAHQYDKLALQEYPLPLAGIDESSVRYLHYLKAYAATLLRKIDIAEHHFALAGINEQLPLVDEYSLYQLNIYALFHVHQQKVDVAYRFEKTIEQFIQHNAIESIGLKYVNFINIARLYKKEGLYNQSLDYYSKAYLEISQGGYTTSDHIYYHMNFGGVYEAMGDSLRALFSWINAALHWLVADNPYSLAWRPKLILCNEKTADLNKPLILNTVSSFFVNKIADLVAKVAATHPDFQELTNLQPQTWSTDKKPILNFCLNNLSIAKESCYIEQGLVVYSSYVPCKPIHPELAHLASYLSKVLEETLLKYSSAPTLVIDNLCDNSYSVKQTQAQWLAIINGCNSCYLNGEVVLLDATTHTKLQSQIKPTFSQMIENIEECGDQLKLNYKRDFLNKELLDQQEIAICKALQANNRGFIEQHLLANVPLLQKMMHKNIISVSLEHFEEQ